MLGYLVIAALACSIGFVLAGILASNRTGALSDRLALAERTLADQTALTEELTQAVRELLASLPPDPGKNDAAVAAAREALSRSEDRADELYASVPEPAVKEIL